jgi:hypothetical protein
MISIGLVKTNMIYSIVMYLDIGKYIHFAFIVRKNTKYVRQKRDKYSSSYSKIIKLF